MPFKLTPPPPKNNRAQSFGDTVEFTVTRRYEGEWEKVAGETWAAQGSIWDEEGRKVGYFNALEVDDEVEEMLAKIGGK